MNPNGSSVSQREEALPASDTQIPNNQSSPTAEDPQEDLCGIDATVIHLLVPLFPRNELEKQGGQKQHAKRLELLTL